MGLTQEQFDRYRQQISLPGMSAEAQARIINGKVLVLGMGAWGCGVAQYLAEVGIGNISCTDENDSTPNIWNQVFAPRWAKVGIEATARQWRFNAAEAEGLIASADAVVDVLDNWQHKLVTSDLCMQLTKPLIHAGGSGFRFQVYNMLPGKSACLRCVFPEVGMDDVPLTTTDVSSMAPVVGMIAALQALEAIKVVADIGATQGNELWKFDWLSGELETIRGLDPRFDCPDCGKHLRSNER